MNDRTYDVWQLILRPASYEMKGPHKYTYWEHNIAVPLFEKMAINNATYF